MPWIWHYTFHPVRSSHFARTWKADVYTPVTILVCSCKNIFWYPPSACLCTWGLQWPLTAWRHLRPPESSPWMWVWVVNLSPFQERWELQKGKCKAFRKTWGGTHEAWYEWEANDGTSLALCLSALDTNTGSHLTPALCPYCVVNSDWVQAFSLYI